MVGVIVLYIGSMYAVSLFWGMGFVSKTGLSPDSAGFDEAYTEAFNRDSGYINIIFSGVCLLLAAVAFKLRGKTLSRAANICSAPPLKIAAAFTGGLAAQLPLGFAVSLLPFSEEIIRGHEELMNYSTTPFLVQVLYTVILAPIIEEIFFRGIGHDRLARAVPPVLAAIISSAAFAVIHMEPLAILAAFVSGLILSLLYNRYKTVIVPIAFHMGFNIFAYIVPYLKTAMAQYIAVGISTAVFAVSLAILLSGRSSPKK